MKQDVGEAIVRDDEAKALGHVEPFDPPMDLDDLGGFVGRPDIETLRNSRVFSGAQ